MTKVQEQIYAFNGKKGWWNIMKAPIPCKPGEGTLLRAAREKDVRRLLEKYRVAVLKEMS